MYKFDLLRDVIEFVKKITNNLRFEQQNISFVRGEGSGRN